MLLNCDSSAGFYLTPISGESGAFWGRARAPESEPDRAHKFTRLWAQRAPKEEAGFSIVVGEVVEHPFSRIKQWMHQGAS